MFYHTRPIVRPPKRVVRNEFLRREIPIIQPVIFENRLNVIDVPRHIVKPIRRNVVVEHRHPFRHW
ncbi:spore coat protein D [Neobacillus novalis]|uniref:Spore coat protein D n=1 Tax=Neobacillus novalis TaxID=220687 RepID=A0AA95MPX3_9BACI|nr:spore coat protein D [Neobacillus novalis]WHY85913.1 spore coat protein D [Neobacillus novalis]